MRKKIFIIVTSLLVLALVVLYFQLDYNESFEIEEVSLGLYKVNRIDSSTNCYLLSPKFSFDSSSDYVLGVRVKPKMISIKREGFSSLFKKEQTEGGHPDTISKIELTNNAGIDLLPILDSSKIDLFNLNDTTIVNHSIANVDNCFKSKQMKNLEDFKNWYNSISYRHSSLNDIFFFSIRNRGLPYFYNSNITLLFQFNDGRSIKSNLIAKN